MFNTNNFNTKTELFHKVTYITIDENNYLQRIDNFLFNLLKKVPKSAIYKIIRKGEIRVNKKRVKAEYKLNINDQVRIPPIKITETNNINEPLIKLNQIQRIEQDIIFEDQYIIVLNKYSGIAVHGGSGVSYGVIESLRKLRPQNKFLELVHRIDRDTSGLLIIAKKRSALVNLQQQLVDKTMHKEYIALVHGNFTINKINAKLLRYKKDNERFVKVSDEGKASETKFTIICKYQNFTLIKAMPITGRTHQIRVHCLHAGYAIAGDQKYSTTQQLAICKKIALNRLFLHAHKLTFKHPKDQQLVTIEAPLDNNLQKIIQSLK